MKDLFLYNNSDDKIESIYKNFEVVIESISLEDYTNKNISDCNIYIYILYNNI